MFNELTKDEKQAFVDSLDEHDWEWLNFLTVESGGFRAVALERLYTLKLASGEGEG